jgi:hypothetical protein
LATYWVDTTTGNDADDGLSEANAKATISAGIALISAAGDVLNIKGSATYTHTSVITPPAVNGPILVRGYSSSAGDFGPATITTSTSGINLFNLGGLSRWTFEGLNLSHSGASRGIAFVANSGSCGQIQFNRCKFDGFSNAINGDWSSFFIITGLTCQFCEFINCTGAAVWNASTYLHGCTFRANQYGYRHALLGGDVSIHRCLFYDQTSHAIYDTDTNIKQYTIMQNTFADNSGSAVRLDQASGIVLMRAGNIYAFNGAYGVYLGAANVCDVARVEAFYSNTSGARNNASTGSGDVTLSADPFTNRASDDYSINNTAGGGADLRAASFPGAFPGGVVTGYLDIGSVQHQATGGAVANRGIFTGGRL